MESKVKIMESVGSDALADSVCYYLLRRKRKRASV